MSKVLQLSPYVKMDELENQSAWYILLTHHKHFTISAYDVWANNYENSVETLQKEIKLDNMEETMNKVVSKSKTQQEFLNIIRQEVEEIKEKQYTFGRDNTNDVHFEIQDEFDAED